MKQPVNYEHLYKELVDAICSPSWLGRERHASVVSMARRMRDSQETILPMDTVCHRVTSHDGPCNGLPRQDCQQAVIISAGETVHLTPEQAFGIPADMADESKTTIRVTDIDEITNTMWAE